VCPAMPDNLKTFI